MTTKARIASRILPPLAAFAAARAFVLVVLTLYGLDPWDNGIWAKWDSGHYLSIAQRGYDFYWGNFAGHPGVAGWQGNAGWMPGYPMMIRLPLHLGFSPPTSGVIVSLAFELVSLFLIWGLFFEARWSWSNFTCLLTAAFFPGMVYYHAVYPISQLNALTLTSLLLALRKRWAWAGIFAGLAAYTYTMGFVMAATLAVWALLGSEPLKKRLSHGTIAGCLALAGLGAVMLMQRISVGAWTAFYKIDSNYGYGRTIYNPFRSFAEAIGPLGKSLPLFLKMPAIQTLFVAGLLVVLTAFVWRRRKEKGIDTDMLILLFAWIAWSFPMLLGRTANLYRAEATLLPMAIVLRRTPLALRLAVLVICLCLAYWMTVLFISGGLE